MDSPDLPRQFVIRERRHRIHDPMSEEKLAVLGRASSAASRTAVPVSAQAPP